MKKAKSYKILILLTTFFMSLIVAFGTMSFKTANASTSISPTNYFESTGELAFEEVAEGEDGALSAKLKVGEKLTVKNSLVIDDFEMVLDIPKDVAKIKISLVAGSYFANGNLVDGKLLTQITKEIEITNQGTVTLTIDAKDDSHELIVNWTDKKEPIIIDDFERVDKTTAKISIELVEIAQGAEETQEIKLKSIDQKKSYSTSDSERAYKQTFGVYQNKFTKVALPRVTLNDNVFIRDLNSGVYNKMATLVNEWNAYTTTLHSVLGGKTANDLYLTSDDADAKFTNELNNKPKRVAFNSVDDGTESTFNVAVKGEDDGNVILETYKIKVLSENAEKNAPVYSTLDLNDVDALSTKAYKAYLKAVENVVYKEKTDAHQENVALGTDIKLPSLRDLVYDETTPYDKLSVSLKYFSSSLTKQSASSMGFKVASAGDYEYYVIFTDRFNNAIKEDSFRKLNKDDANKYDFGVNKDYIFKFNVQDNAPISIKTSNIEGLGYIGVEYKAAKFDVNAEGCTTTYTLYYNENPDAERNDNGWKVIPVASKLTDKNYDQDGISYSFVKSVNYDGALTFTPTKKGAYKIECQAVSEYTTRTDSAYSIVSITKTPQTVEVPNYWLRDNVWSVVFFSVGTICLIGIIVLLCIKPKEEINED